MKNNPEIDFSNDIIKASLENFAYDAQCEGSRAEYIYKLIQLSKQHEKIRKAILKSLSSERKNTWALVQLFDLATIFAKQGDIQAKKSIYKRFFKKIIDGSDWCGYDSIISLDGLDGLFYIADRIGRSLKINPGDWHDDMIIKHFQENYPSIDPWKELEKAGRKNENIKSYFDCVKRTESVSEKYTSPHFDLNTVKKKDS